MTRSIVQQPSSIISSLFIGQIAKKIRIFPLMVLLFSPISVWMLTEAIAPQVVRAYTARVDLSIDRMEDESYETILRRAEAVARAAAQRSLDQDILVTDVSVIVTVQSYGAIAPILALDVSRQQWRTRPDPQRWAKYFKTARSLLFFNNQPSNPPNVGQAAKVTPPEEKSEE